MVRSLRGLVWITASFRSGRETQPESVELDEALGVALVVDLVFSKVACARL
jgi:hypothetical protein